MFMSDHGEIIDAYSAGHGGNCSPVKVEYHVPFIFWWSEAYAKLYPNKIECAKQNVHSKLNGDCVFYSACDMANILINTIYSQPTWSVFSNVFEEHPRLILLPDGVNTIDVN